MSNSSETEELEDSCYCRAVRIAGNLKSLSESRFKIHALFVGLNSGIFSGEVLLLVSLNGDVWVPKWLILAIVLAGTILGIWLSAIWLYGAIIPDRQRTKFLAKKLAETDESVDEEHEHMNEWRKVVGTSKSIKYYLTSGDLLLPPTFAIVHVLMGVLIFYLLGELPLG